MRHAALSILAFAAVALSGCDTFHGVKREASVHELPDLARLKARLESYPEQMTVEQYHDQGDWLFTWTGIHDADEVFTLIYRDHEFIQGVLQFTRHYDGKIRYSQYKVRLNHPPPQASIDLTWPIMKRIEQDLAQEFGLSELRESVEVDVFGDVEDPDRPMPGGGP